MRSKRVSIWDNDTDTEFSVDILRKIKGRYENEKILNEPQEQAEEILNNGRFLYNTPSHVVKSANGGKDTTPCNNLFDQETKDTRDKNDIKCFSLSSKQDGREIDFNSATKEGFVTLSRIYKSYFNQKDSNDDNDIFHFPCLKEDKTLSNSSKKTDECISPSDLTHKFLPLKMKNNELFKVNLMKLLRKVEYPHTKTETCKTAQYRKLSQIYDGNVSKYYNALTMKRRKITSERKTYEGEHPFFDTGSNNIHCVPHYFKFYSDCDIGFTTKWQRPLKVAEMDDDINTEDDQLEFAKNHVRKEICEGIRTYKMNKQSVRNISLLK